MTRGKGDDTRLPSAGPGQGPGRGGSKRGYSWPPFEQGHTLSTKHGAHSARKVQPLAERARAQLLARAPWLEQPIFAGAVAALSTSEAKVALLEAYVAKAGALDPQGSPRPALAELGKWLDRAARLRSALGLDPSSWARLRGEMIAGARGELDLAGELVRLEAAGE